MTNLSDIMLLEVAGNQNRHSPFSRRVIFAPRTPRRALDFLVLDCGHSVEWSIVKTAPDFLVCSSCSLSEKSAHSRR
jgi:hypothetical protein